MFFQKGGGLDGFFLLIIFGLLLHEIVLSSVGKMHFTSGGIL